MLNTIKYFISTMVVLFSHIAGGDRKFFDIWIFFAVLSTMYSYVWDLKKDWNLGDTRFGFLREKLLYINPNYYYGTMVINFGLRCMWVFTLSGAVVN